MPKKLGNKDLTDDLHEVEVLLLQAKTEYKQGHFRKARKYQLAAQIPLFSVWAHAKMDLQIISEADSKLRSIAQKKKPWKRATARSGSLPWHRKKA